MIPSPSPSVKIQIMGGKFGLRCKGNILLAGYCQQTFESKKLVDISQQCVALLPRVNFPANNLNFHWRWRWWDQIQAIFLNIFYFTSSFLCCFLSSFWFYFSMSLLFSFLLSRVFFCFYNSPPKHKHFFSLIFPLFFHFDGPFPLKIDFELILFKRIHT